MGAQARASLVEVGRKQRILKAELSGSVAVFLQTLQWVSLSLRTKVKA